MKSKRINKRFIPLIIVFTFLLGIISAFRYANVTFAENEERATSPSVELNVEKVDRDRVKLELDNFSPVIKSLQISVKINGNVKFKDDGIKWLANSDLNDVKSHLILGNDNKTMEIFIVSNDALNKTGSKLEICEVQVEKISEGSSEYTIDSNINSNGISYSYVINDTNRQVSGNDMANLSKNKFTISSLPVITLVNSSAIRDGKIVINKGDTFDAKSYIEINDDEDGVISTDNVIIIGTVDTNKPGTYTIKYLITDSEGDTGTLEQIVIVKDDTNNDIDKPGTDGSNKPAQDEEKPGVDSGKPGSGESDKVEQDVTKPGTDINDDIQIEGTDNNKEDNKIDIEESNNNYLPQTGQGIFYGIVIVIAIIVIALGIYLVTKKKR